MSEVKFHISKTTGNPNRCYARPGNCPNGSDEPHYATKEDARAGYEMKHGTETIVESVSKTSAKAQGDSSAHMHYTLPGAASMSTSPEKVANALAYAQENGVPTVIAHTEKALTPKNGRRFSPEDDNIHYITKRSIDVIANPDGTITRVAIQGEFETQEDEGSEVYYPGLTAETTIYKNYKDYRSALDGEAPEVIKDHYEIDQNEVFNGKYPTAYDKWDLNSVIRATQAAHDGLNAYAPAKVAYLKNSTSKIAEDVITSKEYGAHPDSSVRAAAVARKEYPKALLMEALENDEGKVAYGIASRSDLDRTTEDAVWNYKSKSPSVFGQVSPRFALAKNPNISSTMFNKIAKEGSVHILRELAQNPSLPNKTREVMKARVKDLGIFIRGL